MKENLIEIENKVKQGIYPTNQEIGHLNELSTSLLRLETLNKTQLDMVYHILIISDILYNNTDRVILPLDDGIYDALVEKYKAYKPFEIHAQPVRFKNSDNFLEQSQSSMIEPIIYLDDDLVSDSIFINDDVLLRQIPDDRFIPMPYYPIDQNFKINKINVNVPHKYPKLVGTLDKCKFTLIKEATDKDMELLKDPTIKIFERDFIGMHIEQGYIDPYGIIDLICELKYDGVSIEAEVTNKIISARSRGDTDSDVAADYTSIFGGMEFPYAPKEMENEEPFGMKFEAIITKENLERLNKLRGVQYINCRVAIIGLLNSSDAYKYRNFITLIPLATSLDMDRLVELEFMNKYYTMGEVNRYAVIHGDVTTAIYQVYKFVQEAQSVRPFIPYMYDGVVVSYSDRYLRETLGRIGAINKFTTAIKFSPLKKQTIFLGYSYSIGQNGVVTPLLHYKPVEFYGAIHTKSSGHSYARFKDLKLRVGDIIDVEYTNDVMPYATKAICSANDSNTNPLVQFPTYCPCCGKPLTFNNKSAICENRECPERLYNRMANMVKVLGIKDFSIERVKAIGIKSLSELAEISVEKCISVLGEVNGAKLFKRINDTLYYKKLKDYIVVSSLGFENISNLTWKKIFSKIDFYEFCADVIGENFIALYDKLVKVKDIGPNTAETIIANCKYIDIVRDLAFITTLIDFGHIERSYSPYEVHYKAIVRFSGIRDQELELALKEAGYDCSGTDNVTKKTDILIVPYAGYDSSKVRRLRRGAVILPIDEARYRLLGVM